MPELDVSPGSRRYLLRILLRAAAVGGGYYVGGLLGQAFRLPPATPSVLWPPNQILTAALLLTPPREWVFYLLAAIPGHVLSEVGTGWPIGLILSLYITNCSEALIAAIGMRMFTSKPDRLDSLRQYGVFLAVVVFAATFLSTFPDALAFWLFRGQPYWRTWEARFLSNVLASLVIVPALLAVFTNAPRWFRKARPQQLLEAALIGTLLLCVCLLFLNHPMRRSVVMALAVREPLAMMLPILLWAAVRFGPRGVSLALLTTTVFSIWIAAHVQDAFTAAPRDETVVALQLSLVSIAIPLIGLAVTLQERRRAQLALRQRLRFEEMLSRLSRRFVRLPSDRMGHAFDDALREICSWLQIERLQLFKTTGDDQDLIPISAWPERDAQAPALWHQDYPWTLQQLLRRETVVISDASDFPAAAARDSESFTARGCRGQIFLPLVSGDTTIGALAVPTLRSRRGAPADVIEPLNIVAETFANALARQRTEDALRASELEAQRMRGELAHFTRVSTMGELTASLAHQLNQPLTGILSNAQAAGRLLDGRPLDLLEIRSILSDIVADDRRAAEVITRMRELLRKSEPDTAHLDLNDLIRDVTKLVVSDALIRNVQLAMELTPSPLVVRGDRVQLQQVVLNLLINALEALGDLRDGERQVGIRSRHMVGDIQVAVWDSGPGFEPGSEHKAFEPFYTTKAGGMGMGLSITRTILEAHGGTVRARNGTRGAIVEFTLPVPAGIHLAPGGDQIH
jgi:two-component system, LuxR family, sensor kinase FixL